MNGKGDKDRTADFKAFRSRFDEIDWTKKNDDIKGPACPACQGEGWLWGRELLNPSEDDIQDTMTQYTCDRCDGSGIKKDEENE